MNHKPLLNLCLAAIATSLAGCTHFPVKRNHPLENKYICQSLKNQMSVNTGHNINVRNDTPIQQVKLYRQYQHYHCDEVLGTSAD